MKKVILTLFAAIVLFGVATPAAQAQHRHRHCWYSHHHRHCRWE